MFAFMSWDLILKKIQSEREHSKPDSRSDTANDVDVDDSSKDEKS
jgi:hypothetical protein